MPTYTNKLINSEFAGAAAGVIGAGGAMPTGWGYPTTGGGVTYTWEVVSLTTVAGQYIVRIKLIVANASGGDAYPSLSMGYITSVASSTLHQIALWMANISFTGASYFEWLGVNQYTAGYGFVSQSNNLYQTTSTFTRATNAITTGASIAICEPYIGWGVPNGGSMTTQIDISQGMFVQGAWLPSYIPTVGATPVSADVWPFRGHNRTYLEL